MSYEQSQNRKGTNAFMYHDSKSWNNLANDTITVENFDSFKRLVTSKHMEELDNHPNWII